MLVRVAVAFRRLANDGLLQAVDCMTRRPSAHTHAKHTHTEWAPNMSITIIMITITVVDLQDESMPGHSKQLVDHHDWIRKALQHPSRDDHVKRPIAGGSEEFPHACLHHAKASLVGVNSEIGRRRQGLICPALGANGWPLILSAAQELS